MYKRQVLIACGTVTSTSLDTLRKENDLPVLGVVEPSCREALAVTKNKKIGMIATLASARSGAYERTLKGLDADVQLSLIHILTRENYDALMARIDAYLSEFDEHGTDRVTVDLDEG